jgi:hypothetical protein
MAEGFVVAGADARVAQIKHSGLDGTCSNSSHSWAYLKSKERNEFAFIVIMSIISAKA